MYVYMYIVQQTYARTRAYNNCTLHVRMYVECVHIHTHMHAYIHACMHTHTHACIHSRMHAYMHTCMHLQAHFEETHNKNLSR